MNYYEHHLGDYDGATAHLTWLEDCAYRRLICLYYRSEAPLPADVKQACRLVRAASKQERDAVQQVLSEFFTLEQDGWHHKRCDEELSRYHDKSAKARASVMRRWEKRIESEEGAQSERNTNVSANAIRTYNEGNTPRARPQTPDTRLHSVAELPHGGEVVRKPERAASASPPSRGSRLPKDWAPGPEQQAFASSLGLVNGRYEAEIAKFRDYWVAQPGSKGVKADWVATLRNWLRRAAETAASKPTAPRQDDVFSGAH